MIDDRPRRYAAPLRQSFGRFNGVVGIYLQAALPRWLPRAIEWAEEQAEYALQSGNPLSDQLIEVACRVGVITPESIRLMVVERLPRPADPALVAAADEEWAAKAFDDVVDGTLFIFRGSLYVGKSLQRYQVNRTKYALHFGK